VISPGDGVDYPTRPVEVVHTSIEKFTKSGGGVNMAVNGSSTPVVFTIAPASGKLWRIVSLTAVLEDAGSVLSTTFGAITALTNGVLIESVLSSTTRAVSNLKNNADFVGLLHEHAVGGTVDGWFGTADIYIGTLSFKVPFRLSGTAGDKLQVTVRDDLTGLTLLAMNATVEEST
jgi:hypothetical protein